MAGTKAEDVIRTTLESMVLPTVFGLLSAASLVAFIFLWYKGLYLFLLPSGYMVFGFGALSFVTWYVRRHVKNHMRQYHGGN